MSEKLSTVSVPKVPAPENEEIPTTKGRHYTPNPFRNIHAPTALADWMYSNGVSCLSFALKLKCSDSQVTDWMKGYNIPSLVYAFRIDEASDGAVPVSSWLATPFGKWEYENRGMDMEERIRRKQATTARRDAKLKAMGMNRVRRKAEVIERRKKDRAPRKANDSVPEEPSTSEQGE
jgi:hypothetical protein